MEKIEPPDKLNPDIVCHWYSDKGELIGNQKTKAIKFLNKGCIEKVDNKYLCKPIKGYNATNYWIENDKCTCQYNKRYNKTCSHILAVKLFIFMENWNDNRK